MSLRNYLNKIKPAFEEGGKLHAFRSVFDGFETFLYVPNTTARSGAHIHDAIDSKRIMSMVVIALMPAMLFGMYNVGYQNYLAAGTLEQAGFWSIFFYGFLAVMPKILVSYIVGLGIEFAWAQWKGEEIQEGYLVSGILIPLIVPVGCPLWILAIACAFAVIFAKEIFGGTGMNIFNVALVTRAFPIALSLVNKKYDCDLIEEERKAIEIVKREDYDTDDDFARALEAIEDHWWSIGQPQLDMRSASDAIIEMLRKYGLND